MADKLTMDKSQALSIAQQIKKISVDNDNAIKALERANQTLRSGWQADAQKAYEECLDVYKRQVLYQFCTNLLGISVELCEDM